MTCKFLPTILVVWTSARDLRTLPATFHQFGSENETLFLVCETFTSHFQKKQASTIYLRNLLVADETASTAGAD